MDGMQPAAFFDRDGVLNVDIGYEHRPEDLVWIPGAREAIRDLNEAGYFVFVLTNQAGVARGYYGEVEVVAFHRRMQDQLLKIGARVDAFYYCPFHHDAVLENYRVANHSDRKPNPGMIHRAFSDWPVRRDGSFLIGDRDTDLEAARRAGIPGYMFCGGDLRLLVKRALADQK
jgi:D-glycero-D-manno-heptose 1,7-bisphosphate phosphatase